MILPDQTTFLHDLRAALDQNGMSEFACDAELMEKFYRLTCRMLEVSEYMNLTTIKQPQDIIMRHYVDSLTVASHIPAGAGGLDIGCGAGFPCLPLALARPDLRITAIDSTEKKVRYVNETAAQLGISPDTLTALAMRAEEGGSVGGQLREKFNMVVSRAVAHLSILGELALPCLKIGGTLIALKGAKAAEEIADAKGLFVLGAAPARLIQTPLTSPFTGDVDHHALVMMDKCEKTPKIYPRKYAQIAKKPL